MSNRTRRVKQVPSLDPLEERLSESIQEVNIIDELSIGNDLRSQLRRAFDFYLQRRSMAGLLRSYPTCFTVHLVAEGIYGYEGGNYWGGTPLNEHKSMDDRREGGQFFETFVEVNGLETFPDRSRRYVSLILLHSSIPNDALPNFFEYALYPAVHDYGWMGLGPRELVRRWPEEGTSKYRLSKTVHTFFREGGEVAVDFVARCLEMAERTTEEGKTPSAEEVRLPERVVEFYSDWWDDHQKAEPRPRTRQSRKNRVLSEPPRIWLNPGPAQIMVDLPKQQLSSKDEKLRSPQWQIQTRGRADIGEVHIDVHAFKSGEVWSTESETTPLPAPARSYNVALTGASSSRSWSIEGLAPEQQLLVFDGDTHELIESPQVLPARPLWLVYPSEQSIEVKEGRQLEQERSLHGPWKDFAMACWDLSSAESVTVGKTEWSVVRQGQGLQPRLVGGERLSLGDNKDRFYTQLPEVRIPVPPDREPIDELSQWELRRSSGTEIPSTRSLLSNEVQVRSEGHALVLPLSDVIDHIGSYEIGIRGPLGRSASFSLSYVGDTSVHLPNEVRLPNEAGDYPEEKVVLRVPSGVQVSSSRDDVRVQSSRGEVHEVVFEETCTQANVELYATTVGSSMTLPLVAPGIQWAAQGEQWDRTWSTRPLRFATSQLEQATRAELLIRLRPSSGHVEPKGTLRVRSRREVLQRIGSKSRAAGRLRFDLREVLDLLRGTDRTLQLQLALDEKRSTVVGRIEASLEVNSLDLIAERSGNKWDLLVAWDTAGKPVRNRCLRLWSKGRPWESPHTFRIPDEARGEAHFEASVSELPPGPYLAALELEDPWKEQFPERPSPHESHTNVVEVGSSAERLKFFWEQGDSVEAKLEQAFLAEKPSETARFFREARKVLTDEDISTLLRTLWWLDSSESLIDQITSKQNLAHRIRREVLNHPEKLVASLDDPQFQTASRDRLEHFLLTLGIPQQITSAENWDTETLNVAWDVWPALGWMLEIRGLLGGEIRSVRLARNTIGIRELVNSDEKSPAPNSESRIDWIEVDSETNLFGGRLEEKITKLPTSRLRKLQHHLDATLRGHFDDDQSWNAVNFDWLVDYKEHSDQYRSEMSTLGEYRETLRSGVKQIMKSDLVASPVASAVLERHDPRPEATLADVPFCSGATALIQRAYAIFDIRLPFASPEDLIRCGTASFTVAQRLYERDLCLMSLAIEQHNSAN